MADEPKLVVALEARLDKFEKQLREAGLIAERQLREIETKTSRITIGVAAGNLLAKGIEAGMKSAIESIKAAIEETKELGSVARKTGLDFETLQRIGGATAMKGMDSKEFTSGLVAAATAMNDINHGETRLSQLLDDNNLKFRETNGQVVGVNRGLELAAILMGRTNNELDKIKIAQIFGLTEKWVSVLGEGPEKLAQMKANANINKELEAGVRATEALFKIVNAIGGEFKVWGTNIATYVLSPLQSVAATFAELAAGLAAFHAGTGNFMEGPTKALSESAARVKKIVDESIADINRVRLTVTGPGVKGLGGRAETGGEKDALVRQEEQLRKNIALREAELATIGMSVGKQEELRQVTLLEEAALRASNGASKEITAQMREQAARAGEVTQRLVESGARWNDMLSTSKELGATLSDAMKGMVLEGKRFDEVLKNIANRVASKAFDKLFDVLFASPSGGGGSIFMQLLGIKAPNRMAGGPVSGGSPYMVGERGPELFVPGRSGMIVPNTSIAGGRGGMTIDMGGFMVDARGAERGASDDIVRKLRAEMPAIAVSAVAQAQRYGALRARG